MNGERGLNKHFKFAENAVSVFSCHFKSLSRAYLTITSANGFQTHTDCTYIALPKTPQSCPRTQVFPRI